MNKTPTSDDGTHVYDRMNVDDLLFDAENPRLVEYTLSANPSQSDLLKALWEKMAVEEVAMSIAHSGYFEHEPLFVERRSDGKFVVIEGNRRLAAVKLLLDGELRTRLGAQDLPSIDAIDRSRRATLQTLPVIKTTRKKVWRYLGFKHVNGPSTWGSYAKAQYVAQVHNQYGVSLDDIATQIGDYSNTVRRMYKGLMVIEQAERAGLFDRKDVSKSDFYFNYIYTGISYPGFRKFLGLPDSERASRDPVPKAKQRHLGELLLWLYGSSSKGVSSLIRSQNPDLRTLDLVLLDPKGVEALRDGLPLAVAHDISLGDERLFRASLQGAKQELQKARGTLSTGYSPTDGDSLVTAQEISNLAEDLLDEMKSKRRKGSGKKVAAG
jgi:ParB-like nuclease domain